MSRPPPLAAVLGRSPVLITGGSGGIGRALALRLGAEGGRVHLVGRDRDRLREAQEATGAVGIHSCDVTDPEAVQALFAELERGDGHPGVVVNSAGQTRPGRFRELDREDFRSLMDVNFFGTLHVLQEAVPAMVERGEGYVMNVSSLAGTMGVYGMSAYCAAKFAVHGLTETLRSELKPHGVVLSLLCPPDTDTRMLHDEVPLRPPETEALSPSEDALSPEAVADAAVEGLSRGRAIVVPGLSARFAWRAKRLVPGIVEAAMDGIVRKAGRDAGS